MAESFAGRSVLVVGVRFAGVGAARALLADGARVLLADQQRPDSLAELEALGATFLGDPRALPTGVDLVWVSPGVPPAHPVPVAAAAAGVEVIGEAELAWRLRPTGAAPWLVVTGTNGKTTTVRMLEAILRADGRRALAVGNVGVSLIDAVTADPPWDVLAVELSSFQLYWSSSLRPAAGALLNLAPDHLEWHGSMTAYAAAKTKAWTGDVAVGNVDDPAVADLLSRSTAPRRIGCTVSRAPAPGELGLADGQLVDRAFDGPEPTFLAIADHVHPVGAHNVANALGAAALARSAGVRPAAVADGLRAFVPDPHRNQFVARVRDVDYVDDSKATNPHATDAALEAYPRVVWIAGGQLKGVDVDPFVAQLSSRAGLLAGAVLLGVDRAQIAAALARHAPEVPVFDVARTDDGAMLDAVRAAAGLARPGETVLLSPAAASYDMFDGYADRGRRFAAAVEKLATP